MKTSYELFDLTEGDGETTDVGILPNGSHTLESNEGKKNNRRKRKRKSSTNAGDCENDGGDDERGKDLVASKKLGILKPVLPENSWLKLFLSKSRQITVSPAPDIIPSEDVYLKEFYSQFIDSRTDDRGVSTRGDDESYSDHESLDMGDDVENAIELTINSNSPSFEDLVAASAVSTIPHWNIKVYNIPYKITVDEVS